MTSGSSSDAAVHPPESGVPPPAAELQRRWRLGQEPQVEVFLAEWPVISPRDLAAVVRVDLRQRWRRGEQPGTRDYLRRFPQLQVDAELVVDLLYAEFLIREELGDCPSLAEFGRQFPEHVIELSDQIDLHLALSADERLTPTANETKKPAAASEQTIDASARPTARVPRFNAGYEILAEIGRGGMGVVYRARQVGLNRLVALKMVRAADFASPELLSRFRAEAETVARLHHPLIVQIYDYGEHEGLPYLALELIEGGSLAARLDGTPWPARQAAEMVAALASAVQFAHERGVIHRDLKPANILLEGGTAKITDFGLAKMFGEGDRSHTETGAILGTPSYMAPEQACGGVNRISPATDIYALGAILYELVTGRPPFRSETPLATLQQVLTGAPISIHLLAPRLPRDLATICSKCLSREPQRRYASAADLANDLQRFLADQPIRARPTSTVERSWRWCRRNPALALAFGLVATLLVCVAAVATWYSGRLSVELHKTQQAERAERHSSQTARLRLWDSYLAEIAARNSSRQVGQRFEALHSVDRAAALLDEIGRTSERVLELRNAVMSTLALPDLRRLRSWPSLPEQMSPFAFSPAADLYVRGTPGGELVVRRLSDGRETLHIEQRETPQSLQISADGRYLGVRGSGTVTVWQIDGPQALLAWKQSPANQFAFVPGGRHAALSDARAGMRLVEIETGKTVHSLGRGPAQTPFSFHAASRRVAVGVGSSLQIISCDTGELLAELEGPAPAGTCIAWHPSGDHLAVWVVGEAPIVLWNVHTQRRAMTFEHRGYAYELAFSGDGSHLLSYSLWDRNLRLWNAGTGQKLLEVPTFPVCACDVTSDAQLTLFVQRGGQAELWEVSTPAECRTLASGPTVSGGTCNVALISPDNRLLAVGRDAGFELWDLHTLQRLAYWPGGSCVVAFDGSGDLVVACNTGVFCWPRHDEEMQDTDASSGSQPTARIRFGPPERLAGPMIPTSLASGPSAELLAFAAGDVWSVMRRDQLGKKLRLATPLDARKAAISGDNRFVAIANWNFGGAGVWDAESGRHVIDLAIGPTGVPQFSPDGKWLATTPDGVHVWRVQDWLPSCEMRAQGTTPSGLGIAFSPDSRVLAIGQPGGLIRLTDPETGADWAVFSHADLRGASIMAFSPDQTQLVTLPLFSTSPAMIWDLAAIRRELAQRGLDWPTEVLQPKAGADSASRGAPLLVALDVGNLSQIQEAADLLRQARTTSGISARDLLQRAAELDPASGLAHNQLAWLLATGSQELRDPEKSVQHARRAAELEPDNGSFINTLGVALCRNEQYGEAISTLERSLELNREQSGAYDLLFLALSHAGRGDAETAREYHAQAIAWYGDRRDRLPANWRAELDRLLAEARSVIAP